MKNRLALLALGLMTALAYGDTHYVSLDGGHTPPFTNDWPSAATNIQDAVNAAEAADTVLISNGTYNLTGQVSIASAMIIQGFGGREATFINGGGAGRCFYLTNGGTFDGLTISNGYTSGNGGGIYFALFTGTGAVYNCTFTNNVAGTYGGGLYISKDGLVTNCDFVGNVATGTAASTGGGGGVGIQSLGTISNCNFIGNIASNTDGDGGGGVLSRSATGGMVYNCIFYSNTASYSGGGARVNCAYNSTFVSNRGDRYGGGAYIVTLASNCIFTYNMATNSSLGYGGGVAVAGGALVANCTNISYNTGVRGGGAYLEGTGAYLQVFNNNGAGAWIASGLLTNSVIYCNTNAGGAAGGIYCNGNNCRMVDCSISNNVAGTYGGGIYYYTTAGAGNIGLIRGCTIIGNVVTSSTGSGGGIINYINGWCNIAISRCTIAYNSATNGGGYHSRYNTGQVENCLFYSNSASSGGGVFFMNGTNLLVNCTIASNAATSGGGIYIDSTSTNNRVINTILYYNSGGMLYGTNLVAFTNCCLAETNGLIGSGYFTNAPRFRVP